MRWTTVAAGIAVAVFACGTVRGESASTLLEKGVYYEETAGDLDAAIQTYKKVVEDAQANRKYAAEAQYRLGVCLMKKGQQQEAVEAFRKVVDLYPDQRTLVQQASEQIRKVLGQSSGEHVAVDRLPAEVMNYIVAEQLKTLGQAMQRGLHVNSLIYGVDDALNLYRGGLLGYRNGTDQTQPGPIRLGNFSFKDGFVLVDENGREQHCEFGENPDVNGGKYCLDWYPDSPVQPGVSRGLGYVYSPTPLPRTGGRARLTMQNYFGPPVLENFFLVVPRGMTIVEKSEPAKSSTTVGDLDIHLWQQSVPANTNHLVTVSLQAAPTATQKDAAGKATVAPARPGVVNTNPPAMAEDVDPALDKITVTFNTPMADRSWSWTGGGDTYPRTTGKPFYDEPKRVCTLPVKLEPGKVYWIGVNSKSFQNFRTAAGVPVPWYAIVFATRSADGKPTPIPQDMLEQAKEINGSEELPAGNGGTQNASDAEKRAIGKAVSSFPEGMDLSSPEGACAAFNRAYARLDAKAVAAVNWYETGAAEIEATRGKADSQDWKMYSKALLNAVVVEVWTHKDDLAGVITFLQFPPGQGSRPFSLRYFGKMDGQWKNYGEDRLATLREARETFRAKQERIAGNFAILRAGKTAASQPDSLKGIATRKIDKAVTEFPKAVDLSSPESACAAFLRASGGADARAIAGLSWVPIDVQREEQWYKKLAVEDPEKVYLTALANAKIVQVLTYRDDLADVIAYLPFPAGKGRAPYSSRGFGRVNGQWKNIGEDRYESVDEAIGQFHRKKDNLYAHFLQVTGKAATSNDSAVQPIDLSSPASTIRGFVRAATVGSVDRALSYVLPGGTGYDDISDILSGASPAKSKQQTAQMFRSLDAKEPVEVVKVTHNGEKADVIFRVKFAKEWSIQDAGKSVTYKPDQTFEMDATLKQVGDGWLIDGI